MVLVEDLVEDILVRLDVKDLTRYKIVCKPWFSLISSHRFAKSHLKKQHNKDDVRIAMPTHWKVPNERLFKNNTWEVVGSSNGLAVCFYSSFLGTQILVNNPWTRELRELPLPPLLTKRIRPMFFGFGYDSSTDDYKIVVGTLEYLANETLFQVLSLKSNTWKLIGVFKEEFTVINTEPVDHSEYGPGDSYVGVLEDQLCLFFHRYREYDGDRFWEPCNSIWVMRSCKGERFWEQLPNNYEMNYQVVHYMKHLEIISSNNIRTSFFCDDSKCLSRAWFYIKSPLFVPSLVSPYVGRPSHAKNNNTSWSLEGIGEGLQLQPSIRRFIIKASEEETRKMEEVYRREVGDTENFYFYEEGYREIEETVTKIEGDTLCAEGVKNNEKEK